jgi:hypothetical protein
MKNTRRRKLSFNKTKKFKKQRGGNKPMKQQIKALKSISMKKLQCSPSHKKNKGEFSCFSNDDLYKLRDLWNMRHPDAIIKTNEPKEIWDSLKKYMGSVCNKESCWLKQNFVGDAKTRKELEDAFAPKSPNEWKKNPNEWLSSVDILDVMKQYEKAYKCFDFIGPSPIDYDAKKLYGECVWNELCNFNLKDEIKNGKTKIGVIFNTDPHYLGGSHWVSLFINVKRKKIFYFDSAGDEIPKRIKHFVDDVTEQGKSLKQRIDFEFDQNYPVEHQYGNTECGIYGLYFIVHMLEDKINEHYLKTHILKDEYMSKFRKIYFNDDL